MVAATLDTIDIIGEETFARHGYPHAAWTLLRREAPVHWWARGVKVPFWAITKHADIVEISKQPRRFLNAPRLAVFPEFGPPTEEERVARHLLNMDPPEHGAYRRLASPHFTPRAMERLRHQVETIAAEVLDEAARGGAEVEGDFVELVAARLPLAVLADLLGVPREDWRLLFRWTNEIIGANDPEYQQGASAPATAERARAGHFEYFWRMTEERRARPREDIVSVLANARLDGRELPPFELLSYFFLLVVAGNETTRNATSGGLLALLEHPAELDALRRDPALLDGAVEEILRWTTPVIQFCRTATEDFELRGRRIRRGDSMCLLYPSANRDEEVFDEPFRFRVARQPNPHLAFGIGEHVCLGAHLARLELRAVFRQLVRRLEHAELIGPVERLRSSFVGGVKHVPLRYRMRPAA
jgi:cytochrome P450